MARKGNGHWKKGTSGNPEGGKMTAELRRVLHDYDTDESGRPNKDPEGNKITNLYAVARALVTEAKKGNVQAIDKCFERIDGKVKDVLEAEIRHTQDDFLDRVLAKANQDDIGETAGNA